MYYLPYLPASKAGLNWDDCLFLNTIHEVVLSSIQVFGSVHSVYPPPPLPPTSHSSFSVGPSCHFYVLMSYLFHLNFSTQQLRVTVCEGLARFTGADWSWSLRFGSERWAKTNEEIFNQRGTAAVPSLSCAKIYTVLTVLI